MNLTEMLAQLRSDLDDEDTPYLWSDADLVGYLNAAQNEVCETGNLIIDSKTAAICQITILDHDTSQDYALDSRVIEILSAKLAGQSYPLTKKSRAWMETRCAGWRDADYGRGTPKYFTTDYSDAYLSLDRLSDEDDTIMLTVARLPLAQMSVTALTAAPEIQFRHHVRLLDGGRARAYRKHDAETFNPRAAADADAMWKKWLNDIIMAKLRYNRAGNPIPLHQGAT